MKFISVTNYYFKRIITRIIYLLQSLFFVFFNTCAFSDEVIPLFLIYLNTFRASVCVAFYYFLHKKRNKKHFATLYSFHFLRAPELLILFKNQGNFKAGVVKGEASLANITDAAAAASLACRTRQHKSCLQQ